jgi:N-acetylglucosamine kinase-like BadF-type ATPase
MRAAYLLGIDGGGTSTVAWLADAAGEVIGRGQAGASNIKVVGASSAKAALDQAIASAFTDAGQSPTQARAACLGLAGFDRVEDRDLLSRWSSQSRWADRLVHANDGDLVIAAGTPDGWGLGVIAGTGSIAVGRTPDGRTARAGGWGPLLGDEGSGYAVALTALRLIARRADGREAKTADPDPLTRRLCAALGIEGPSQLVATIYAPGCDRTQIAALAAGVVMAARDDPDIDRAILEPAGRDLAEAVLAVARTLGFSAGPIPLALAGGFLLSAPPVSGSLLAQLASAGLDVQVSTVTQPVRGAVILAKRAAG